MIRMAVAVLLAAAGWLAAAGGSARALVCLDPQSGAIRESGTDSCYLGERQILPDVPPRQAPPAASVPPPARRPPERCPPSQPSVAALIGEIRNSIGQPRTESVHDSAEAGWSRVITASFRNDLTIGKGRIVIEALIRNHYVTRKGEEFHDSVTEESYTVSADLGRLDPHVEVGRETRPYLESWSRLTLTCASGNCWRLQGRFTQETESSTSPHHTDSTPMPSAWTKATFLVEQADRAEAAAQALSSLIELCRAPPPAKGGKK